MGIRDFFNNLFTSQPQPKAGYTPRRYRDKDYTSRYHNGLKYGPVNYREHVEVDTSINRVRSRQVYRESTIARGIVKKFNKNVINTGLTWESSPIWDLITDAPRDEESRYAWTQKAENLFTLYAKSTEPDLKQQLTLSQLQRLFYNTRMIDGEFFTVLRYLNSPSRVSPVACQVINNDQIQTPYDAQITEAVKKRGGEIKDGIELDSMGVPVAIYVQEDFSKKAVRIPYYGAKSKRRFVIHSSNIERLGQVRGFPELSALIYELSKLTDFDIAELEATVASALWIASIEATEKAAPGKAPMIKPNVSNTDDTLNDDGPSGGVETVEMGRTALIMNNLAPGYSFKSFKSDRPNQNYTAFVEAFETRICGALGMPRSVFAEKFEASYSAARAEILFFWNEVTVRRDDFVSSFLEPLKEAVISEWVKSGVIQAPGYDVPIIKKAWLYGSWNGISRPVVDPVKEVKAVELREKLGHTTKEREAKAYNGSDYRENVKRLKTENELIADANKPLDPEQYAEPEEQQNNTGGVDREND